MVSLLVIACHQMPPSIMWSFFGAATRNVFLPPSKGHLQCSCNFLAKGAAILDGDYHTTFKVGIRQWEAAHWNRHNWVGVSFKYT